MIPPVHVYCGSGRQNLLYILPLPLGISSPDVYCGFFRQSLLYILPLPLGISYPDRLILEPIGRLGIYQVEEILCYRICPHAVDGKIVILKARLLPYPLCLHSPPGIQPRRGLHKLIHRVGTEFSRLIQEYMPLKSLEDLTRAVGKEVAAQV